MVSFPDGNIILKAVNYECRVHRDVVSQHSTKLGNTIARAIDMCGPGDVYPTVIVSDDDDLLELFINAIYMTVQYVICSFLSLYVLLITCSSLLLKARYPVKDFDKLLQACTVFGNMFLRRHLIDILARDYPDTWDGWLNYEKQNSTVLVYERGVEFDALALCRRNNVSRCVPALLYKITVAYSQVRCILISGDARLTALIG